MAWFLSNNCSLERSKLALLVKLNRLSTQELAKAPPPPTHRETNPEHDQETTSSHSPTPICSALQMGLSVTVLGSYSIQDELLHAHAVLAVCSQVDQNFGLGPRLLYNLVAARDTY